MSRSKMLEILKPEVCQNDECQKPKKRGVVFCPDCYFRLDEDTKHELYSHDPDYFMDAVEAAKEILTA